MSLMGLAGSSVVKQLGVTVVVVVVVEVKLNQSLMKSVNMIMRTYLVMVVVLSEKRNLAFLSNPALVKAKEDMTMKSSLK